MSASDPAAHLPLPDLPLHILLALAEQERHGWAVIKRIEELTERRRSPSSGSLYLAMSRMEERGLTEEAEAYGSSRRAHLDLTHRECNAQAEGERGAFFSTGPGVGMSRSILRKGLASALLTPVTMRPWGIVKQVGGSGSPLRVSCALTACLLTMMAGCDAKHDESEATPFQGDPDLISLEDFDSLRMIGLEDAGDPVSVFREPRDGLFLEDEIIVLDASPPWVRTFDRSGRLLDSMGPEGEGPGEAENPFGLTRTKEGLLLWQAGGAVGVGPFARGVVRLPAGGFRARGGRSCDESLLSLMMEFNSPDAPGLLVRVGDRGAIDTLMVLGLQRTQALQHPFFATRTDGGLLFYPEEKGRDRLLEVSCDGEPLREITIEPLGPPEEWQRLEEGWQVRSAKPPFPGGVARVGSVVLWAAQEAAADGGTEGSTERRTVFTSFPRDDEIRRIAIPGWFQLFDEAPDGRLMLATSDSVPRVVVINGHELLRLMGGSDSEGE